MFLVHYFMLSKSCLLTIQQLFMITEVLWQLLKQQALKCVFSWMCCPLAFLKTQLLLVHLIHKQLVDNNALYFLEALIWFLDISKIRTWLQPGYFFINVFHNLELTSLYIVLYFNWKCGFQKAELRLICHLLAAVH